jgi:hypothetical protein
MAIPNTDIRLISVKLETLRPTQMTVGYREVSEKRAHWKSAHWKTLGKRLRAEGGARLCARSGRALSARMGRQDRSRLSVSSGSVFDVSRSASGVFRPRNPNGAGVQNNCVAANRPRQRVAAVELR